MSKTRQTSMPKSATIIAGSDAIRFNGDIAFDIETAPVAPDAEDGNLLSPETARVAAIGYYEPTKDRYLIAYDKDEPAVLRQFWDAYLAVHADGSKMVGFNIFGFDLPFLMRRSWLHGVSVPRHTMTSGGRYWSDTFVDLMALWKCGSYRDFTSLDSLARFLGVGAKNGNGEQFYRLWDKDRPAAIDYLVNDVKITHACAQQMGLVPQSV